MSKQYRALGESAEVQVLRQTNLGLSIFVEAAQEYFGPFPAELDKRLAVLTRAKFKRYPPCPPEEILADVREVVRQYRRDRESGSLQ